MDIQKQREEFEDWWVNFHNGRQIACDYVEEDNSYAVGYANAQWVAWQAAKAQIVAVPDHCDVSRYSIDLKYELPVESILERTFAFADDCAEDYWKNHDGWESTWPLEFHLYESDDANKPFHKCSVSMEMNPNFSCKDLPND